MAIKRISSGSIFEEQIGYSRAVVAGPWVLVSGTTGYDYASMNISDDLVEQTGQCLRNIEEALRHAGCSLDQVVRVHYIVAPGQDFSLCWPLLKKAFDQARPAATMWHAELANSQMKIEIEVTAYLGEGV
jgi:enamine deaminase RidA (YjgF/YER057c/UK114 family)